MTGDAVGDGKDGGGLAHALKLCRKATRRDEFCQKSWVVWSLIWAEKTGLYRGMNIS